MTEQVSEPRGLPFVGNLFDLADDEASIRALERLADLYGPIYKVQRPKGKIFVVATVAIVEELCDESRFVKIPPPALAEDNSARPAGLFGSTNEDPDWGQAHRILMPAFGPLAIENCLDGTYTLLYRDQRLMGPCRDEGHSRPALPEIGSVLLETSTNRSDGRLHTINSGYDIAIYHGLSLQFLLYRDCSSVR